MVNELEPMNRSYIEKGGVSGPQILLDLAQNSLDFHIFTISLFSLQFLHFVAY